MDVYSDDQRLVATRELGLGDILIAVRGGHGFRVLEDTVLLEIKQGPYPGGGREGALLIPVNEPLLTEADYASVMGALRSGWISGAGPHIEAFEARWAAYCGRKHGIALANGTVALQVAVALLDLQPGDEVIMPTFTIISCALPVVLAGADPGAGRLRPADLDDGRRPGRSAHHARTRAIMPVHIYGHPVDMDPLLDLAAALRPARSSRTPPKPTAREYRGRRAGSFGTSSCFSFYANKLLTTGEGGMLLVDDDELAERARRLRNLGFQPGRRFLHAELGFNFRLTNLQAALGRDPGRAHGRDRRAQAPHGPGVYRATVRDGRPRAAGAAAVGQERVLDVRPGACARTLASTPPNSAADWPSAASRRGRFSSGMHEQPVLRERGLFAGESYPVAERIARQGLYLPSGLGLEEAQIDQVCQAVREALAMTAGACFGRDYAAAYDDLYQDKDYLAECDLIERVFKTYGQGPVRRVLDLGLRHGRPRGGAGRSAATRWSASIARPTCSSARARAAARRASSWARSAASIWAKRSTRR